ncbi:MAG: energy transducer TonB [Methylophilaceae bacterium]|nr:energy transducer TonB [Methylophilaceae bacterium]
MAIHLTALAILPAWEFKTEQKTAPLVVELQPPPPQPILPQPIPPQPSPPEHRPAEPEQPQAPPKKPLPKPLPTLEPEAHNEPPAAVHPEPIADPPPPPPQVIAAAPQPDEPAPTFVAPPSPPEPPPKLRAPSELDIDAAKNAYGSLLAREFAKHKQYPRIAQMRGWQGIAKVELHLDASGNVISSRISEPSGYEVLDKQALEMVRKAVPLPLPPEALRGREFTILVPVVFRLE